ncbi:MAG: CAP domain-containing protein [Patescibacteria group bacterium]
MPKRILKKIHYYTIPHKGNDFKPHSLRHKTLLFYSALLILVKIAITACMFLVYPTSAEFSTITTNRIIELTNKERAELNLQELRQSEVLNQAATLKLNDMFKYNYFAHTSPQGVKPWNWFGEANYNYTYAGENLAMDFLEAEDAVQAWMDSETHRDNIMSKNYDEIGIAVGIGEIDGHKTTVVVQLFGKRYVRVAGEKIFEQGAREAIISEPSQLPIDQAVVITNKADSRQVTLENNKKTGWLESVVKYSNKIFFGLLIFLIINLILTIIIRIEIQHKPIIMHTLFVIALAILMLLWKIHFMEGLGDILVV